MPDTGSSLRHCSYQRTGEHGGRSFCAAPGGTRGGAWRAAVRRKARPRLHLGAVFRRNPGPKQVGTSARRIGESLGRLSGNEHGFRGNSAFFARQCALAAPRLCARRKNAGGRASTPQTPKRPSGTAIAAPAGASQHKLHCRRTTNLRVSLAILPHDTAGNHVPADEREAQIGVHAGEGLA